MREGRRAENTPHDAVSEAKRSEFRAEKTPHDAVSEAKWSELAGVSSVREAGIPPSSESDKE